MDIHWKFYHAVAIFFIPTNQRAHSRYYWVASKTFLATLRSTYHLIPRTHPQRSRRDPEFPLGYLPGSFAFTRCSKRSFQSLLLSFFPTKDLRCLLDKAASTARTQNLVFQGCLARIRGSPNEQRPRIVALFFVLRGRRHGRPYPVALIDLPELPARMLPRH